MDHHLWPGESGSQFGRDTGLSPECAGELATDSSGSVGIVAEVDRLQDGVRKVDHVMKRPEGGFEALDHVTAALDVRRL